MKETIISVLFAIGYVILVLLFIAVPVFCLLLIWGGNEILILRLLGTDVLLLLIIMAILNISSDWR
jgi:hypothetical protein